MGGTGDPPKSWRWHISVLAVTWLVGRLVGENRGEIHREADNRSRRKAEGKYKGQRM